MPGGMEIFICENGKKGHPMILITNEDYYR